MSEFFSPNYAVLKNWQQTVTVAFQQLRRIKFVVRETFSFGNYDPQVNWQGMTVSGVTVNRARYLKLYKIIFLSIDFTATLAAPLTNFITVVIPEGINAPAAENGAIHLQGGAALVQDNGVTETGTYQIVGGSNLINFFRSATANFNVGVARVTLNTFIEIE